MLFAAALILIALWFLGVVSGAALGVWVHWMLFAALLAGAFGAMAAFARQSRRLAPRPEVVPPESESPTT